MQYESVIKDLGFYLACLSNVVSEVPSHGFYGSLYVQQLVGGHWL